MHKVSHRLRYGILLGLIELVSIIERLSIAVLVLVLVGEVVVVEIVFVANSLSLLLWRATWWEPNAVITVPSPKRIRSPPPSLPVGRIILIGTGEWWLGVERRLIVEGVDLRTPVISLRKRTCLILV